MIKDMCAICEYPYMDGGRLINREASALFAPKIYLAA